MEQKIQVDKNAFQQVTTIQNGQIQKLAELVKMNNFYASRKGQYNYQTNYDKDISKQRDEDFKVQTQVETLTDPYEY
jgi:phosphate-selective porin